MTLEVTKLSEQAVSGPPGPLGASKITHAIVQGGQYLVNVAKASQAAIEGPPPIIPPASQRRQLLMPS